MAVELITFTPQCLHNTSMETRNFDASISCPRARPAPLAMSSVHQPTLSGMPQKPPKQVEIPKVVPLTEEKRQVIATDQKSQRVIVGIGQQRIAFDIFTRITR